MHVFRKGKEIVNIDNVSTIAIGRSKKRKDETYIYFNFANGKNAYVKLEINYDMWADSLINWLCAHITKSSSLIDYRSFERFMDDYAKGLLNSSSEEEENTVSTIIEE